MRSARGVTLIEVLISAVIAALLLSSLASFFAISLVKRAQGNRLGAAVQLAQSQVNEVRSFWNTFDENGESYFDKQAMVFAWSDDYFPTVGTTNNAPTYQELTDPTLVPANASQIPTNLRAIPVDTTGDGEADFLAQVFVGQPPDVPPGELRRLVVRIYDKFAPIEELDQTPVLPVRPLVNEDNTTATQAN
ncbi:prepilin-type N-terminal cleavage/methylation domain-containing protein, partial [Candidatus Cyanaurora vandensis]